MARFNEIGFPTPRMEEWKATNVAPIATTDFAAPDPAAPRRSDPELPGLAAIDLGGPRLVFVNGRFSDGASTPRMKTNGVWIGPLAEALESIPDRVRPHLTRRDPSTAPAFEALNAAFMEDGAVVLVEDGADAGPPIHLVFLSTEPERPTAMHPRTLIAAGRGSRVRVVETYVGQGQGVRLTNSVGQIFAGDDSQVEHYRIQTESPGAYHIATQHSRQTRDSRCSMHNIHLGGRLVRQDSISVLDGEGAYCRLNGLILTHDRQHVDNHTVLDHAKPHGDSRELYKSILEDDSTTVFNGRIIVREDAQKTDAKQSNRSLLLSRRALAHSRPQLEIYADDVKCTHGATVGRLDENAVFYLRSRGLSEAEARNLLIGAFAGEVLEQIEIEALRSHLEQAVAERLRRVAG
jgi:Fe-S cluster assembly protein SufD